MSVRDNDFHTSKHNSGNKTDNSLLSMTSSSQNGCVVWITGLSGAGKSTLALRVQSKLQETGIRPVMLDGDALRNAFGKIVPADRRFESAFRKELGKTYARLGQLFASQGHIVIVSTVSLFHEIHQWNRDYLPGYIEVFLDTPIDIIRNRKVIYSANDLAKDGPITGVDFEAEKPTSPDFQFTNYSIDQLDSLAMEIVGRLKMNS